MKKYLKGTMLAAMTSAMLAGAGISAQAQTVLTMGYGLPADSFQGACALALKSELEKLSDRKFVVNTIPSYLGGNDRALIESVQLGTVQLSFTSTAVAESFVPGTGVLDLPFIVRDVEHARIIQEGPIGEDILSRYKAGGLIGVALGGADFRNVTTSAVPVRKASDLRNLKMRTMQAETHLLAFKALGALPTPIAFPELYTALQTGTVDGEENPISVIHSGRLYEVQKYISMTRHVLNSTVVLTSPDVWQRLSERERGWFRAAGKACATAQRERIQRDEGKYLDEMKAKGFTVIGDVDVASFQQAMVPAYAVYEKTYGKDLIDRIRNAK